MPAIGKIVLQDDGSYIGELNLLTGDAPISIEPVRKKVRDKQPDFRVFSNKVELGTGRTLVGEKSLNNYVTIDIATPEFGPRRLKCNLGPVAGDQSGREFVIIWNPE